MDFLLGQILSLGRRNSRQEVISLMVTERDKSNCEGINSYLRYYNSHHKITLMLSKVKIFYSYKEDKVNTTELYKIEAFPRSV